MLAKPGEPVYAPIDGYASPGKMSLKANALPNVHVKGEHKGKTLDFSLGYVKFTLKKNQRVKAGQQIGVMIDLSKTENYKDTKGKMKNHLHLQLKINGSSTKVDPTRYITPK